MDTIFGELELQGVLYHFQFDEYILQIHKAGSDADALQAMVDALSPSAPKIMSKPTIGTCYPDGHKIYFMQVSYKGFSNNVKKFSVGSYFEIDNNTNFPLPISQVSIVANELNYIYPPTQMYSYQIDAQGIITAMNFTRPKPSFEWKFSLEGVEVTVSSGFTHSYKWNSKPVEIQSMLHLSFKPTEKYEFVVRVFNIAQNLLQYLCYRQNINCTNAYIYAQNEEGKNIKIGIYDARWMSEQLPETEKRSLKKKITFMLVENGVSNLLQRLADNTLYSRHIPDNSKDERRITPARSIMLTAAFEWEYKQVYLNGKKPTDSFKERLVKALNDYSDCIGLFAQRTYSMNNRTYDIDSAAEKIKIARNDFAHGDIKIDYDLETLMGISILPYLVYAMQLRAAGVDTDSIKHAINELFALHMI